ncbi:hypothetical protein THAOC_36663 [Thalassiosira oceanica]|uniref:Uncharacterized protein n=1 Tax=Thalassiosira oceanica TaxID=159749 RepID=K0R7U0_THAOC|nr:hypothetical protein THAOC_36663 [Thalassiosira oceanica]|eukprot:EJK44771.1 hypothetical protein THAOC_36663 [Thalassiosira oceanica]
MNAEVQETTEESATSSAANPARRWGPRAVAGRRKPLVQARLPAFHWTEGATMNRRPSPPAPDAWADSLRTAVRGISPRGTTGSESFNRRPGGTEGIGSIRRPYGSFSVRMSPVYGDCGDQGTRPALLKLSKSWAFIVMQQESKGTMGCRGGTKSKPLGFISVVALHFLQGVLVSFQRLGVLLFCCNPCHEHICLIFSTEFLCPIFAEINQCLTALYFQLEKNPTNQKEKQTTNMELSGSISEAYSMLQGPRLPLKRSRPLRGAGRHRLPERTIISKKGAGAAPPDFSRRTAWAEHHELGLDVAEPDAEETGKHGVKDSDRPRHGHGPPLPDHPKPGGANNARTPCDSKK